MTHGVGEACIHEQRRGEVEAVCEQRPADHGARRDARERERVRQRVDVLAHGRLCGRRWCRRRHNGLRVFGGRRPGEGANAEVQEGAWGSSDSES
jgi:hypothetical protein